jgi:quinol monooxygenase YgiN
MTTTETTETIRAAVVDAAVEAYEDAGVRGLCLEGRWEAAVSAMRSLDLHADAGAAPLAKETRPAPIEGARREIHELARYEVRPEALPECLAAIHEFVAHVRANEPGALRYEVWQEAAHPTRFVHIFVWRDEEASRIHGESEAVKRFAGILYPNCLAPVEFRVYEQVDANAAFRRV